MIRGNRKVNKGILSRKNSPDSLKTSRRSIKNISEAIILQSIEDLWDESRHERRGSFAFFLGDGFRICSELAGISASDRRAVLSLIVKAIKHMSVPMAVQESRPVDRVYAVGGTRGH